ncbi:hypothetical protein OU557_00190, partial [Escherichia coli]|nr:hypothetical protein [Escherichia coli]
DRNRSHWSTSKTPSYTKSVSWQHHPIPRARVMNDTRGVLKAIVDNKTQRILGASLLCVDSHEMINIVKMVMDAGLPYSILRDQIFTHPSMSESLNDLFSLVK